MIHDSGVENCNSYEGNIGKSFIRVSENKRMLNQAKTFRIIFTTYKATGVFYKSGVKFLGETLGHRFTWEPQIKDTA